MRQIRHSYFRQQFQFLRRQYLQEGDLSIQAVLSDELIQRALDSIDGCWKDRIYTPMVTLWVFLRQVISADHSCRAAVARLIVHRISQGLSACSARTGAYCQARKRLPEEFFSSITRGVGEQLESQTRDEWLWNGHHVFMFDGTTALMPDTPENREAYPPPWNSKTDVVLPLLRIGAVFSLACGAMMDLAVAKYAGKGQGEVTLLRQLAKMFSKGDVLLADCLMCNWRNIYELQERGVHLVSRLNKALRKADFRKGKRLGKDDHIVEWSKPHIRGVGRQAQLAMPRKLAVREARVRITQPGFRTRVIIIVTTLLDPQQLASPFGWLLILPFVLTATSLVLEPYIGPEMFATHVIRFWHGFACFVCGIILVSLGEQFWQGIRRICHVALPVALVLYLLRMTEIGFESQPVAMAMRTTESACGMLTVLGYGGIFFNQPSRIFSVLNRAVFAVYIVHLPVQQIVAYYLFRSEMNTWLAFALHLLATLGISYLLYAMLLPIRWLHPFFGIAPVKAKHSGANPSAEKTPRQPSWPSIAGRFATLYVLSPLIVLAVSIGVFASMLFNVAGTLDGTDKAIEASVVRFRSEIAMRSPDENYREAQGLFASLVQALESRNIDRARILIVEIELIDEGLASNGESESEVEGIARDQAQQTDEGDFESKQSDDEIRAEVESRLADENRVVLERLMTELNESIEKRNAPVAEELALKIRLILESFD